MAVAPSPPDWASLETISETKLDSISTAIDFLRAPPRALLTRSSNQSISNTTNTAVQFDAEAFDTHGGHDTVTNNSRYTAPYDGIYQINYAVPWLTNTTQMKMAAYLRKSDGVEFAPCENMKTSSDITISLTGSTLMTLATGEYVELYVWQNRGSSLQIDQTQHGGPRLSIVWVGATA